jgi:hypothetical protein
VAGFSRTAESRVSGAFFVYELQTGRAAPTLNSSTLTRKTGTVTRGSAAQERQCACLVDSVATDPVPPAPRESVAGVAVSNTRGGPFQWTGDLCGHVKFAMLCLLTMRHCVWAFKRERGKIMSSTWVAIVLVLAAVITAVWIGLLGFGLLHLIERII